MRRVGVLPSPAQFAGEGPGGRGPREARAGAIEQIGAFKARVATAPAAPAEVAAAFAGAPAALVACHLETLVMVGEVRQLPDNRYEAVAEPL